MKTINGLILLRRDEGDAARGGILLPKPENRLVECRVKYNAEVMEYLDGGDRKVKIAYYANSKVWIRADARCLGTLGDADLYRLSDIVAEG